MKSILMLMVSLTSMNSAAYAQNLFSTYESPNELNLVKCMKDHGTILNLYGRQLNSEIARGLKGIQLESKKKSLDSLAQTQLKKIVSRLVVKKILVDELMSQSQAIQQDSWVQAHPRDAMANPKLFDTETIDIGLTHSFQAALEEAAKQEGLGSIIVHTYLHELKSHAVIELGERTLHAIGSGLFMEIIKGTALKSLSASAAKTAVTSFGASVIKGAGWATVLTLLTEPLKGGRKPPETIWLEILSKSPELVINPQWMNQAGSPDAPWPTHCYTLNRKGKQMTQVVQKLLKKEESIFMNSMLAISDASQARADAQNHLYPTAVMPADNTAVYQSVPVEVRIPSWARKN